MSLTKKLVMVYGLLYCKRFFNVLKFGLQYDLKNVLSNASYLKITLRDRSWGVEELEVRTLIPNEQS